MALPVDHCESTSFSPLPWRGLVAAGTIVNLPFVLILLAGAAGGAGSQALFWIFIVCILIYTFGIPLHARRTTPFEQGRRVRAAFDIHGINLLWRAPSRLILYEDAMEIRIFFHAYLIPYDRLTARPQAAGTLSKCIVILSRDTCLSPRITLHASQKRILVILDQLQQASGAHGEETP
jgi:hypothetical protein